MISFALPSAAVLPRPDLECIEFILKCEAYVSAPQQSVLENHLRVATHDQALKTYLSQSLKTSTPSQAIKFLSLFWLLRVNRRRIETEAVVLASVLPDTQALVHVCMRL